MIFGRGKKNKKEDTKLPKDEQEKLRKVDQRYNYIEQRVKAMRALLERERERKHGYRRAP